MDDSSDRRVAKEPWRVAKPEGYDLAKPVIHA